MDIELKVNKVFNKIENEFDILVIHKHEIPKLIYKHLSNRLVLMIRLHSDFLRQHQTERLALFPLQFCKPFFLFRVTVLPHSTERFVG